MTPAYTLSLPSGHTLSLATDDSSQTYVRLDDGPWTLSEVASMHKILRRFMDLSAAEIPGAWEEVTKGG